MWWMLRALRWLLNEFEAFKGRRHFKQIPTTKRQTYSCEITLSTQTTIKIHCDELRYVCEYSNPLVPDKHVSVYHVYCVCGDGTPAPIRKILDSELFLTRVLHGLSSADEQRHAAILAYTDLLSGISVGGDGNANP